MVLIITIKERKLKIAIKILFVIIPEAITTDPSSKSKMTLNFKNLNTCCISNAMTSVPPVAHAWFNAIPMALPTSNPPNPPATTSSSIG